MEWTYCIAAHLVKEGLEKRMEDCKARLENATEKELKKWNLSIFLTGKSG